QPLNGHIYPTHRLADEWNIRNGIYVDIPGTHRHHRDHERTNNNPWNIQRLSAASHIRHHNVQNYGDDFDAEEHGAAIREALGRRKLDVEWRASYSAAQRQRAVRFWNEAAYAEARHRLRERHLASWTPERRVEQSSAMRRYFSDPDHRRAQGERSRR